MDIINRQSDSPKIKAFRQNAPPAAGSPAGRRSLADETSLSKNMFYLAARKIPQKGAPKKRGAKKPRGERSLPSHDLLFREIFSNKQFAADILLLALSRERYEFLDMKTLKLRNPVLFTKEGQERRADLIFSISTKAFPRSEGPAKTLPLRLSRGPAGGRASKGADTGAGLRRASGRKAPRQGARTERAEMLAVVEHKSSHQAEHWQQFLDYLSSARRTWRKKGLMLPVLVSSGQAWRGPLDFQGSLRDIVPKQRELFGEADLNFRPVILNLRDIDLKKKAGGLKALPIWFIFQKVRNIGERDVAEFFRLCQGLSEKGLWFLAPRGLSYLRRHNPRWTIEALAKLERKTIKKKEGRIMAMSCYQEELYKERQEGRQEERRAVILSMLQKNLDISLISEVTGQPKAKILKLKNGKAGIKNGKAE